MASGNNESFWSSPSVGYNKKQNKKKNQKGHGPTLEETWPDHHAIRSSVAIPNYR